MPLSGPFEQPDETPDRPVEYTEKVMPQYSLEARYDEDHAFVSGLNALVRGLLDVGRRDPSDRRGFISGYQGSPLGTLDMELSRQTSRLDEARIRFQPGLNEELALTSVWGSQMVAAQPDRRVAGVWGAWYGKAPGLDRSLDALRHANLAGCAADGGAVAIVGDDPAAKSSTVPSASEAVLAAAGVPVIAPRSIAEIPAAVGHAVALSRTAGTWSGLKLVTALADATAIVTYDPFEPVRMPSVEHHPSGHLLAAASLELERSLIETRLPAAIEYVRRSGLNRVTGSDDPRLTVVAAGHHAMHVLSALASCGLDERRLQAAGIRIVSLAWLWPIDEAWMREVCQGVVWVVDDKRSALDEWVRASGVTVVHDLMPLGGEADPDRIVAGLHHALKLAEVDPGAVGERADAIASAALPGSSPIVRAPSFCSGCPHNTILPAPDGTLVGAGIGCHTMVLLHPEGRGDVVGLTQMGGEGAQWIGMEGYLEREHLVQNLGDGTYHHSGSLAVRAAVAAGSNITYRLMFNSAVAMTGGQEIEGGMSLESLVEELEAEGVSRVVIISETPARYNFFFSGQRAEVWSRDRQAEALEVLAAESGVTVLIYDGECAAERRRKRKRGVTPEDSRRIWINERVCEGCGDCGDQSGCLSVEPVETAFGRKTLIHQASCNQDRSCLRGNCPSFVEVIPGTPAARVFPTLPVLNEPTVPDAGRVRIVGIGGTGIVTVSQILGVAAELDGKLMQGLDQTGLSQKGGPVVSDVVVGHRISRVGAAEADVLIAADVVAALAHRRVLHKGTLAVVNTTVAPTVEQVTDVAAPRTDARDLIAQLGDRRIERAVGAVSQAVFGQHIPVNLMLIGMTSQAGVLPVSPAAVEAAIRLNGVAVEGNLHAFALGRALVQQPSLAETLLGDPVFEPLPLTGATRRLVERIHDDRLRDIVARNAGELIAYGDERYACEYLRHIVDVEHCEAGLGNDRRLTTAIAQSLYHLMAIKDEYEVARLHLDPREVAKREALFGADATVSILLHPPLLKRLGMKRKLRLRRSATPLFRLLYRLRRLRGTRLDPFSSHDRRIGRELLEAYIEDIERITGELDPARVDAYERIARLPLEIRGYDSVRATRVERYWSVRKRAWERLDHGDARPIATPTELPVLSA